MSEPLPPSNYRILVPLERGDPRGALRLAMALAQARGGEVLALHVSLPDHPEMARSLAALLDEAEALPDGPRPRVLSHAADSVAEGIVAVARREKCHLILLGWRGQPRALRNRLGHILDPVLEEAPCDVALLKGTLPDGAVMPLRRILLAAGGGPNALEAARLAFTLAGATGATITLLTILPEEADGEAEAEAEALLERVVTEGQPRHGAAVQVERRIVRGSQVVSLLLTASQKHDLVLLGASGTSIVNQLFLGSIVERVAEGRDEPLLVFKRAQGLPQRTLRTLWQSVNALLPELSSEERLDAYKRLRRGARATIDFYVLILLSVVIATMGLLLNSGAVVVGAMLVAPLMSPILGLGLAVVMGDVRLLRLSATSTARGILLALGVSLVMARIAPLALFTSEVAARTQPNLFDLTVALAAGMAGAYSVSRRNVAAALPGVAIAAALVPPLSVVGICLATARWEEALGAALLFGTNLVAISLAGALVYLLLGFFPQEEERERTLLRRRGFLVILLLLFVLTVPLTRSLEQTVNRNNMDRTLRETLESVLNEEGTLSLFNFEWDAPKGKPLQLRVLATASGDIPPDIVGHMDEAVTNAVGREVDTRLFIIPLNELSEAPQP